MPPPGIPHTDPRVAVRLQLVSFIMLVVVLVQPQSAGILTHISVFTRRHVDTGPRAVLPEAFCHSLYLWNTPSSVISRPNGRPYCLRYFTCATAMLWMYSASIGLLFLSFSSPIFSHSKSCDTALSAGSRNSRINLVSAVVITCHISIMIIITIIVML